MRQRLLVTTYTNPDIDGIASCLAFSKISAAQGVENKALFWGKPQPEVDFITLNMLVGVTDRDKTAARYLFDHFQIEKSLIEDMFSYVDSYDIANLEKVLGGDLKEFEINGKRCVGGQILLYGAKSYLPQVAEVSDKAKFLSGLPFFVKADDMKINKSYLYCPDPDLQGMIKTKFGSKFSQGWTELSPLILRKKLIKTLSGL